MDSVLVIAHRGDKSHLVGGNKLEFISIPICPLEKTDNRYSASLRRHLGPQHASDDAETIIHELCPREAKEQPLTLGYAPELPNCVRYIGQIDLALKAFRQAKNIFASFDIGKHDEALESLLEAKEIYVELRDHLGIANCVQGIGTMGALHGRISEAFNEAKGALLRGGIFRGDATVSRALVRSTS
ncbi:hypothetical protein BT69DRAFT_1340192 [Atractiella rhizophila]|nr:hypothetical protein BT69DRAFT_1340192 [Atractiella rhizophila]